MLKGGVIMDVTTPEQAKIAEAAGACAVMALERIPADIRAAGGVSRMSDPKMIKGIQEAVSIPVMAKCRIGHYLCLFGFTPRQFYTVVKTQAQQRRGVIEVVCDCVVTIRDDVSGNQNRIGYMNDSCRYLAAVLYST